MKSLDSGPGPQGPGPGGSFLQLVEKVGCVVERAPNQVPDIFGLKGKFHVEHWRDGEMLSKQDFTNLITDIGKQQLLNIMFESATQITTWFIGLVDNSAWSAFAAADTMVTHAGWVELQAYNEATRNAWTPGAASGTGTVTITNGTAVTFTMNATHVVKGIFINSIGTKGGTTGTLWAETAFAATVAVNNADLIKVTYTVSC